MSIFSFFSYVKSYFVRVDKKEKYKRECSLIEDNDLSFFKENSSSNEEQIQVLNKILPFLNNNDVETLSEKQKMILGLDEIDLDLICKLNNEVIYTDANQYHGLNRIIEGPKCFIIELIKNIIIFLKNIICSLVRTIFIFVYIGIITFFKKSRNEEN